jgi:glycosyltransferase involved in cell wall biosynthesis
LEGTRGDSGEHPLGRRLIYFAPADLQTARVDRNCVVKFCEAMAEDNANVTLVSLKIRVLDTEPTATRTTWDVFGVKREFELVSVPTLLRQERGDTMAGSVLLKTIRAAAYPFMAARLLLRRPPFPEITALYIKNYGLVPGLCLARLLRHRGTLLIFEAHVPPNNLLQRWALSKADGIVCNGYAIHQVLLGRGMIDPQRSIAVHQGFTPESYPTGDRTVAQEEARHRLGWSPTDKVAVYTGKVYWPYAEVKLLLQAASRLAADGIRLLVVGGRSDHVQLWRDETARQHMSNVSFTGFVAPSEIVDYQVAADVLLSYYPSGIALNDYRSPGKLFEYMASGTPIVAADYASLREVLRDEDNALLIEPDNPELLAQAVRRLVMNPALSARLGEKARKDAEQYTWVARAEKISAFVSRLERK